jgi:hypothetical protein
MDLRHGLTALAAVLTLPLLGACSSNQEPAKADTSSTRRPATTTTAPAPPTYPLTGLPVVDENRATRPALTVKIDNAPMARPQAGLELADMVIEEVVEGGVTRFLAVFHSQDADSLGPVRSVRPVDPALVTPLRGLFAYSGGAPKFVRMLQAAPIKDVGFDTTSGAYQRQRGYRAPHNLFTSTPLLFAQAGESPDPPPPALFEYLAGGATFGGATASPANVVSVVMGDRTSAEWRYDAAAAVYRRATNGTPHVLVGGQQYGAENVIVQRTSYRETGDVDVSGARVPEAAIVGDGEFFAVSGGVVVRGRWSKAAPTSVTQFTLDDGTPLRLEPGRTWVMLQPTTLPNSVTP